LRSLKVKGLKQARLKLLKFEGNSQYLQPSSVSLKIFTLTLIFTKVYKLRAVAVISLNTLINCLEEETHLSTDNRWVWGDIGIQTV
jgi:hypothetical protein